MNRFRQLAETVGPGSHRWSWAHSLGLPAGGPALKHVLPGGFFSLACGTPQPPSLPRLKNVFSRVSAFFQAYPSPLPIQPWPHSLHQQRLPFAHQGSTAGERIPVLGIPELLGIMKICDLTGERAKKCFSEFIKEGGQMAGEEE